MNRLMKCFSLSLLMASVLFCSGCAINRSDFQDAITAPVVDAVYAVIAAIMAEILAGAGLPVA